MKYNFCGIFMVYKTGHEMYSQGSHGVGIHGVLMDAKFMGHETPIKERI